MEDEMNMDMAIFGCICILTWENDIRDDLMIAGI